MTANEAPVCLVVGAGDFTGGAIARRFAREGFIACVVRRHRDQLTSLVSEIEAEGHRAVAFGVDARDEEQVVDLVERIERDVGPIEVAVFNIGANVNFSILETTSRVYRKVWEMAAFSGFLTGRESAKRMVERGHGTILFTGATASVRGGVGYSAFSGAKHALRALAQSMARELGPKSIHVAHVIIDGGIDTAWVLENLPGAADLKAVDGLLDPEAIADNYWHLYKQPKNAWTHELDLRPYMERF
ncbi:MAG: SDR family oxidoreductase [Myxococcota bacterium]